ncbi:hypothetical protein Q5752_004261 [Cryptotrichosporon argae]
MSGTVSSGANPSVWVERDDLLLTPPTRPALAADIETDVLVVGAGVAGLHIAYELLAAGTKKVVVVEDGKVGSGETGRTTGHLSVDNEYNEFLSLHGATVTAQVAEAQQAAVERIAQIVEKHGIACDFARVPGYMFHGLAPSDKDHDQRLLESIYDAAAGTGKLSLSYVDDATIPGFKSGRAIRFDRQATYHPTKYVRKLAQVVEELGGKIYETTHVQNYEESGGDTRGVTATTSDGKTIKADAMVMATNVPLQKLMIIDRLEPFRSYALAFKVPTSSVSTTHESALWWDLADPYHYVRVTPHKDDGFSLLVVGGEDDKVGQHGDSDARYARLEQWTRERWSGLGQVEYRWSGQVWDTLDGLAYIGRDPGYKNIYIHTGDNGDGLTYAAIGGLVLSDLLNGRANAWAHTFSPMRQHDPSHLKQIVKLLPDYITDNLHDQIYYAKWFTRCTRTMSDIEDLVSGQGDVVRDGIHPTAVYKDEKGQVHKMSAVCPHLKGIVAWNGDEKSFDCPIHGSRFTCDGNVVNGPAKSGLASRS